MDGWLKELVKQFPNLAGLIVAIAVLLLMYNDMNMRFERQFDLLVACLAYAK